MTREQKKLLQSFGDVLANWDQQIIEMTPEEFADLEAACKAVSPTNCWCCIYDAAQVLSKYIDMRRHMQSLAGQERIEK